ncbi:MAG: hypothetical protein E7441_08490 [Ruminococcaceae bacterium]|nr:hypothetical protein [Oscillospiraceae bacterium]
MSFIKNGAEIIQKKIDCSAGFTVISGNYEIEKTINIPSDFHLVLENCNLRMADNTFCNMFTNENCRNTDKNDRNIIIEGRGNVILDGGEYNGLSERNCGRDGRPEIYVNNIILFGGVRGFKVTGLHVRNQRWWALNFVYCRDGYIANIDFCADDTYLDENGEIKHRLDFDNYEAIRIKNADGIDIRRGCRDIIIENITGFTEDDTVAVTSLPWKIETALKRPDESDDICNIVIRNVMSSALCSNVRLLCRGGGKLYNVLVDGVFDTSKDSPHMTRGIFAVRVGDATPYNSRGPRADEFYNISVRNVVSRARTAVQINNPIGAYFTDNIMPFDGCGKALEIVKEEE